ncbi:putative glycoside hydrolase [Aquabacterium sp.]|uniref:putative glycoside hydrolase n=1 Tax=Aquabacterium sp. TaxID=1872578 RepID=UPI0025C432B0|nr:putative glycoside hydrolase [Aquabacterium sp.]
MNVSRHQGIALAIGAMLLASLTLSVSLRAQPSAANTPASVASVASAASVASMPATPPVAVTPLRGMVIDADTKQGIPLAYVVSGDTTVRTDHDGRFTLPASMAGQAVGARMPGYRQQQGKLQAAAAGPTTLTLRKFESRGLYLSAWGIGSSKLRGDALALMAQTDLNTLVIDVKGDAGIVPYRSEVWEALGYPKQTVVTVHDMPALIKDLHDKGIYLIARVVTFKDDKMANAKPQWAIKTSGGAIWKDREGLSWLDPSIPATWEPAVAMAEEAAKLGFDEIQFDYVRFPDTPGLQFSQPNTWEVRPFMISAFLDKARQRLAKYNVYMSADIFGYVCWNLNDTLIGQQLEMLSDRLDYLSPMLYPSGFTWGIPGHVMAVGSPYEIVHHSLQAAIERSGMSGVRFRPWLQSFKDYAFDRRVFGEKEIRAQIQAAEDVHAQGWLLWNASNHYSTAGLNVKKLPMSPAAKPATAVASVP